MLMTVEMMMYCEPVGENKYHFNTNGASKAILKKAVMFEEGYSEVYGHQIFDNIDEIKEQ